MSRFSLVILLGVIELILLTLIGFFFWQWQKKEALVEPRDMPVIAWYTERVNS